MKKIIILYFIFIVVILWLNPIYCQDKFIVESQFGLATEIFLENNFYLAEDIFRDIIIENPESSISGDSYFMMAESKFLSKKYKEAINSYIKIMEKFPSTKNKYIKELYYRIAQCYYHLKIPNLSIKYLKMLLESYPENYLTKDSYLLIAECYLLDSQYEKAIDALNKLEKYTEYKGFDYVYYLKGKIFYEKSVEVKDNKQKAENAEEAIRYFDRVIKEYPESHLQIRANFRKANVLYSIGRYKQAIEIIRNILKKEKDEKVQLLMKYFLAWNYYMTGNIFQAMKEYDEISMTSKDDILGVWAKYKKGMCFEAIGENDKALSQYKSVEENYPSTIPAAYASYSIAYFYYKQKKLYEALDKFNELIEKYNIEEIIRVTYSVIGDIYLQLNDIAKAISIYETIEKDFPDEKFKAMYMRAWCYFKMGDFKKSIDTLTAILSEENEDDELKAKALIKIGDCYYEMDSIVEAEGKYNEVIEKYKKYPDILAESYYAKGWIKYKNNDYDKAKDYFTLSKNTALSTEIKLKSDFMIANTLYSCNDFNAALKIYLSISSHSMADSNMRNESLFYSGWCYYRKEDFDSAITQWVRYYNIVTDPLKKAESLFRIGWAYFRKNDFLQAAEKFQMIIDNYKQTHLYQESLLKVGDCYYNHRDYNKALSYYKEIVDKFPTHYRVSEALYGIQWSYYQLGEYEKAIDYSRQFVEKYPESSFTPEIQYRIAEHYYNINKFESAIKEFEKFIEKYPQHELVDNAYYWTGISCFNLSKFPEAINSFKILIEKYPDSNFIERAMFKTANAYYKMRDYEKALEYFNSFISKFNKSDLLDDAYFNIAMTYKRLDKDEEAKVWYKKLIDEFKNSNLYERAHMNLGYILQDSKQYDEAIDIFKKVVVMKGKKAVEAQFWIADCFYYKKDYDRAIKEY
ncbi:MAG: tetratricopeptide repeat protein, partial [Candidatus Goldbacteria bacterium]|nr:tetratricopeptide repeat protein [Candidatus Goldiibacteriota bacterium]